VLDRLWPGHLVRMLGRTWEDVEFYTKQPFNDSSPSGALSSARILYFFTHRGNKRSGTPERPSTSWVLAFDFVNDGVNNQRSPDPVTLHPVMKLRGNGPTHGQTALGRAALNDWAAGERSCGGTSFGWRRRGTGVIVTS